MKSPSPPHLSKIISGNSTFPQKNSTQLAIELFTKQYVGQQSKVAPEDLDNVRYLFTEVKALQKLKTIVNTFQEIETELRDKEVTLDKVKKLTTQEQNIVTYIASGMQTKEIANKLYISEHTVQTHRKNINKKLGVKSAIDLVKISMIMPLL